MFRMIYFSNQDLLCFEPYTGIDEKTLTSLFDPDEASKIVPDDIFSSLFSESELDTQPRNIKQFKEMIRKLNSPILYEHLHDLFDEFSIFHGRVPKVSSVHL